MPKNGRDSKKRRRRFSDVTPGSLFAGVTGECCCWSGFDRPVPDILWNKTMTVKQNYLMVWWLCDMSDWLAPMIFPKSPFWYVPVLKGLWRLRGIRVSRVFSVICHICTPLNYPIKHQRRHYCEGFYRCNWSSKSVDFQLIKGQIILDGLSWSDIPNYKSKFFKARN